MQPSSLVLISLLLCILLFLGGCGYIYQASLEPPDDPRFKEVITERAHTLTYREDKEGAPHVVYIHGKLASGNDLAFSEMGALLRKDFSLFSYDRPGSGHSLNRKGWWHWSPEDFSNHLHDLLGKEGITKPILVGHSWGGAVALRYALDHPENVRGMVLLAPAAYPWPGLFATSIYEMFISSYLLSDIFLQTIFVPVAKVVSPFVAKGVFKPHPVPDEFKEYVLPLALQPRAYQMAARDTVELRDELKKQAPRYSEIEVPIIVLSDDDDRAVPARIHGGPLVEAVPNGEIRYIEDVGHNFIYVKPEDIAQAVRDVAERTNG